MYLRRQNYNHFTVTCVANSIISISVQKDLQKKIKCTKKIGGMVVILDVSSSSR